MYIVGMNAIGNQQNHCLSDSKLVQNYKKYCVTQNKTLSQID